MKKSAFRGLLRLAAFFLAFAVFVCMGGVFFLRTDLFARMMLLEMQERDDLDLVFIGSSVCRDHVNPRIISEATGRPASFPALRRMPMPSSLRPWKE